MSGDSRPAGLAPASCCPGQGHGSAQGSAQGGGPTARPTARRATAAKSQGRPGGPYTRQRPRPCRTAPKAGGRDGDGAQIGVSNEAELGDGDQNPLSA